ncbi:MAG: pyridoxal 5'-phosphate synthase glutaminase subunit PdxT [bacterium]|nr:pyridoxal 5'-phosphate synthase glutaminase subunit PdxT [bacterium]
MNAPTGMPVGLLALQGDYERHEASFRALGCATARVRRPGELARVRSLVIPGGESTTLTRLIDLAGLRGPLLEFARELPVMGTCAGLIMLARELADEAVAIHGVRTLGVLDCAVRRNAYGRQVDSFTAPVALQDAAASPQPFPAVFIRAPRIVSWGRDVEILAEHGGSPVAVRQGRLLGLTFHPELTGDLRLHRLFLGMG